MEQQLKQEQHLASVLQHSLDDRIAELDLERVEKEVSTRASDLIYMVVWNLMMHTINLWLLRNDNKGLYNFTTAQCADYMKTARF